MDLPLEITNSVVLYRAHKEIPKGPKNICCQKNLNLACQMAAKCITVF